MFVTWCLETSLKQQRMRLAERKTRTSVSGDVLVQFITLLKWSDVSPCLLFRCPTLMKMKEKNNNGCFHMICVPPDKSGLIFKKKQNRWLLPLQGSIFFGWPDVSEVFKNSLPRQTCYYLCSSGKQRLFLEYCLYEGQLWPFYMTLLRPIPFFSWLFKKPIWLVLILSFLCISFCGILENSSSSSSHGNQSSIPASL